MPIQKICETCENTFSVPPSRSNSARFCSANCFYKWLKGSKHAPRITFICPVCGISVTMLRSKYEDGRKHYCSKKCMMKARPHKPRKKRIAKTCAYCGKEFKILKCHLRRKGHGKFCSKKCANAGRKMPKRAKRKLFICEICGKKFFLLPSQYKRPRRGRFCSASCRGMFTVLKMADWHKPTSIEQALIDELDNRAIHYEFQHPVEKWILDFAFPDLKVAVEADGIYWHNREDIKKKDRRKNNHLWRLGWIVLHFTGDEIRDSVSDCVDQIEQVIASLQQ